ncbi:uncharacterized protein Z518_02246 [Rhinocladiella mackenziei CBS 650.93]|uniref:Rhinocladiella mackenziei CBS 650.93 unplaced genomic scaffold supercont1.2, whole genome shotgun sequence n=1 Tax=Rhinocladiella mackenziei CBS 650.93 TaxID=1442369 RepID=A0A0D2HAX5_9EURO|nr:uncharacterized protein Z518_02246 [Rhinocladiella mackenziei CBS 650.93]KIX07593.1 hypothetical protein Z518_02246 [Rhinocladiella mackenziei CBS 650.93]
MARPAPVPRRGARPSSYRRQTQQQGPPANPQLPSIDEHGDEEPPAPKARRSPSKSSSLKRKQPVKKQEESARRYKLDLHWRENKQSRQLGSFPKRRGHQQGRDDDYQQEEDEGEDEDKPSQTRPQKNTFKKKDATPKESRSAKKIPSHGEDDEYHIETSEEDIDSEEDVDELPPKRQRKVATKKIHKGTSPPGAANAAKTQSPEHNTGEPSSPKT